MNWQTPAALACVFVAASWLVWGKILPVIQGRGGGCCAKGCSPRQTNDNPSQLQGLCLRPSERNLDSPPIASRSGFDNL